MIRGSTWAALLLLVARAAAAASPGSFADLQRATTLHRTQHSIHQIRQLRELRGGASVAVDRDDEEYDYDEEYDSEDEPIVTTAKKLAVSTMTAMQKKKAAAIKAKVRTAMASSGAAIATRSAPGGSLYKRYVPYIVRACLNPITLFSMTKAYFVSLCDINYLKEKDQTQNLRSALEEKARKQQPPSGPPRRKMKRGQAKTLSDLPRLSA